MLELIVSATAPNEQSQFLLHARTGKSSAMAREALFLATLPADGGAPAAPAAGIPAAARPAAGGSSGGTSPAGTLTGGTPTADTPTEGTPAPGTPAAPRR
jgi:hypothetical protein